MAYRKAHHRIIVTRNGGDEFGSKSLNGICPRLVARLAACNIIGYLSFAHLGEFHRGAVVKDGIFALISDAKSGENMMLCADSLGIGSCMIARAQETFETERGQELMRQWGISEEYEAKIHIMFGYPEGEHPAAKPRREGRVIRN